MSDGPGTALVVQDTDSETSSAHKLILVVHDWIDGLPDGTDWAKLLAKSVASLLGASVQAYCEEEPHADPDKILSEVADKFHVELATRMLDIQHYGAHRPKRAPKGPGVK